MDSLDKIINDMESMHRNNYMNIQEMPELWAMHQYLTGQNVLLQHYLTRLKALRESNTKTLLDQVREVMAQKDKSHSQITDEIIKVIENYESYN